MPRKGRKGMLHSHGKSAEHRRSQAGRRVCRGPAPALRMPRGAAVVVAAPIISEVDRRQQAPASWMRRETPPIGWRSTIPTRTTAVNLSGWSLNYAKTGGTSNSTWTIPNNVVLGPGEFRVIFCDSSADHGPGRRIAHEFQSQQGRRNGTNWSTRSGVTISSLTYPALSSDTSYGPAETVTETDLVAAGATATYYAPTNNTLGHHLDAARFQRFVLGVGPHGPGVRQQPPVLP